MAHETEGRKALPSNSFGCAAGLQGCIFTTGLTIMGSHFFEYSGEYFKWGVENYLTSMCF